MGVGVGTSPLLYKDLLILQCDEDNGEKSFVTALDAKTGKPAWRVARKVQISWATPVIVRAQAGGKERDELVTAGTEAVIAYDPATGAELWRSKGLESNAVPSPVAGKGVVVLSAGYPAKIAMAIKPGGSGDVSGSPQVLWTYAKSSPVAFEGQILLFSEDGDTHVIKAGPQHEVLRTNPLGEPIQASPAISQGSLFIRGGQHLYRIKRPAKG